MNKEKIKIYGRDEDKKAIKEILSLIADKLPCGDKTIEVFADRVGKNIPSSTAVVRIDDKDKCQSAESVVTYSEGFSDADVVALNPQRREQSSSFEIMTEGFMGRAFMRNDCVYSAFQLLMVFCAIYALGVSAPEALEILNDFTMKRNEE